jgi:hypothetical protein
MHCSDAVPGERPSAPRARPGFRLATLRHESRVSAAVGRQTFAVGPERPPDVAGHGTRRTAIAATSPEAPRAGVWHPGGPDLTLDGGLKSGFGAAQVTLGSRRVLHGATSGGIGRGASPDERSWAPGQVGLRPRRGGETANAMDSKSIEGNLMRVRLPPPAPISRLCAARPSFLPPSLWPTPRHRILVIQASREYLAATTRDRTLAESDRAEGG